MRSGRGVPGASRTIAVDLPGRGAGFSLAYHLQDLETFAAEPSPMVDVTAAETIGHVVDVVRRVRAHGPVVLVGHSYGGLVITGVANAIPDQLDRLVYVSAQDRATVAALKEAIAADCTDEEFLRVAGGSQPDEVLWHTKDADALTPDNPFEIHTVASSHGGFFRRPREVADILAGYC